MKPVLNSTGAMHRPARQMVRISSWVVAWAQPWAMAWIVEWARWGRWDAQEP